MGGQRRRRALAALKAGAACAGRHGRRAPRLVRRSEPRAGPQHSGIVMKLALENLGKTVGVEMHLADISCAFSSGINMVLGPTGAGKTSLLRLLAGLDRPTSGKILLDGT